MTPHYPDGRKNYKHRNKSFKIKLEIKNYIIEYKLKPTESIIVDNGVFLGFDSEISINTTTVGGLKSFFFSGEGLVSEMKNNTQETRSIFLQSRSKIFYNDYIKKICASDRLKNSVTYSATNSIFSSIGW